MVAIGTESKCSLAHTKFENGFHFILDNYTIYKKEREKYKYINTVFIVKTSVYQLLVGVASKRRVSQTPPGLS